MGCDIHCYIEYKPDPLDPDSQWDGFGGEIRCSRHYGIFAALADVRNGYGITPISQPRGLPSDVSYEVRGDNHLYVVETQGDGCVDPKTAAEYVASGYSKYMDEYRTHVTHPDWHSHSWCTADELESALKNHKVEAGTAYEYWAIVAALRSFETQGCHARLVFWFDN